MTAIVDGRIVEVDGDLQGRDIIAPREIVTTPHQVRAERSYETLRADFYALEEERVRRGEPWNP